MDLGVIFLLLTLNKYLLTGRPAEIWLFKVNNRNTRTMCEICPEVSIGSLKCYLLTYFTYCSNVCIIDFKQVITGWKALLGRTRAELIS